MLHRVLFALCSAVSLTAADPAALAIVEKVAGSVSFYTENGRALGRVKVGNHPHEATLSADGRLLYVSNNGVLWMTEDTMGGNTISVIDVAAMKKLYDIDLGRFHRPHGIAVLPKSGRLLATTERPFGLVDVDPTARKVVRDYDVKGKSPHMVHPSPNGEWAFVSNTDSDTVAAIELRTGAVKLINAGAHPQGGVFSPSGDLLYMTAMNDNQIAVIDAKTHAVTRKIPTGKGPARLAITPDGRTLIYNAQFEPAVGFADAASGKQLAMVAVTGRPLSLTMTPDGRRAFAGIQDQDKVFVISVADRKVERIIELPKGSGPDPVIPLVTPR
jgi:YVTN family beta-propeller protein